MPAETVKRGSYSIYAILTLNKVDTAREHGTPPDADQPAKGWTQEEST